MGDQLMTGGNMLVGHCHHCHHYYCCIHRDRVKISGQGANNNDIWAKKLNIEKFEGFFCQSKEGKLAKQKNYILCLRLLSHFNFNQKNMGEDEGREMWCIVHGVCGCWGRRR